MWLIDTWVIFAIADVTRKRTTRAIFKLCCRFYHSYKQANYDNWKSLKMISVFCCGTESLQMLCQLKLCNAENEFPLKKVKWINDDNFSLSRRVLIEVLFADSTEPLLNRCSFNLKTFQEGARSSLWESTASNRTVFAPVSVQHFTLDLHKTFAFEFVSKINYSLHLYSCGTYACKLFECNVFASICSKIMTRTTFFHRS